MKMNYIVAHIFLVGLVIAGFARPILGPGAKPSAPAAA